MAVSREQGRVYDHEHAPPVEKSTPRPKPVPAVACRSCKAPPGQRCDCQPPTRLLPYGTGEVGQDDEAPLPIVEVREGVWMHGEPTAHLPTGSPEESRG